MASATVRIGEKAHRTLRELASESGQTMQAVLERAVEAYWRHRLIEQSNAAYAALRADPEAWAEVLKERAEWDATLMDGLDPNERWTADGDCSFAKPEDAAAAV